MSSTNNVVDGDGFVQPTPKRRATSTSRVEPDNDVSKPLLMREASIAFVSAICETPKDDSRKRKQKNHSPIPITPLLKAAGGDAQASSNSPIPVTPINPKGPSDLSRQHSLAIQRSYSLVGNDTTNDIEDDDFEPKSFDWGGDNDAQVDLVEVKDAAGHTSVEPVIDATSQDESDDSDKDDLSFLPKELRPQSEKDDEQGNATEGAQKDEDSTAKDEDATTKDEESAAKDEDTTTKDGEPTATSTDLPQPAPLPESALPPIEGTDDGDEESQSGATLPPFPLNRRESWARPVDNSSWRVF